MIERCTNRNSDSFHSYGARGIKVCEHWRQFKNFLADMGQCPDGLSIDRIDNDGNYEPGNCRWASKKEQERNKRTNVWVDVYAQRMILADAVRLLGVDKTTVKRMSARGLLLGPPNKEGAGD